MATHMTGAEPLCLIVPGLDNSGPDHWQTLWQQRRRRCRRAEFGCWSDPSRSIWTARLDDAIRSSELPIVLIGHSLGCLTIAWWAEQADADVVARISGALLVAPPDVDRADAHPLVCRFAPAPQRKLPFRSILVGSRNDPYAAFDAVRQLGSAWGSRLVDAGACGHINAQSAIGTWPQGEALLEDLIAGCRSGA